MAKVRNIKKILGARLFYDGTLGHPQPAAIGNGPGMDAEYMGRMIKVFEDLSKAGLNFTIIYHLGGDFAGSRPWHSNGVALDIQGFELNGEKFIMDPGFGSNSYKKRPEVWLRVDAALRKQFTFNLGYPYPQHHNHFHPQPGGNPDIGQIIYDPGRKGESATMFLQQALNFQATGRLDGPLEVDGDFGDGTLKEWNKWRKSRGLSSISQWSKGAFLSFCDEIVAGGSGIKFVVDGKEVQRCFPILVNGRLRCRVRPLADHLNWTITKVDDEKDEVTLKVGPQSKTVPLVLEDGAGNVFLKDLVAAGLLEVDWSPTKRTATLKLLVAADS